MTQGHTVISLDVGDRRIGVAVASLEARLPSPLVTLDRKNTDDIFETVMDLVTQQQAVAVVVGLPRDIEGRETAQTAVTRAFAEELRSRLQVPLYMQDEAGTSLLAKAELEEKYKTYEKGDVDKLAATYILRDWLTDHAEGVRS